MLYEFALTPGIFGDKILYGSADIARDLIRVLEGLCDNGLVGDLAGGELRPIIGKAVSNLPTGQLREEIRICLEILDKRQRFVERPYVGPGWPDSDLDWLDEALGAHSQESFHAI